jgi:Fe-S-cluster containining protein
MLHKQVEQMRRIQAKIPRIECKGLCYDCCGPIGMTPMESLLLNNAAGHEVTTNEKLRCSALDENNRCSAYEHRPLICRMWGVAQGMLCEHGCEIVDNEGRPLNFAEAAYLFRQMDEISPGEKVWTAPEGFLDTLREMRSSEQTLTNILSGRQWKDDGGE